MRDTYGVPKMIAFLVLFALYVTGIIVAAILFGPSSDPAIGVLVLGGFLAAGLAFGIGGIE